jgi:hypothetical protein
VWVILIRSAVTSIFGSAYGKWFLGTKAGVLFQTKLDYFMEYLSYKYDINITKKEEKWRSDYPLISERIDSLEKKIQELEMQKQQQQVSSPKTQESQAKDRKHNQ